MSSVKTVRKFLNMPGHHTGAHIYYDFRVEDDGGRNSVWCDVQISDCGRQIGLDFDVYDDNDARPNFDNAIHKAELLEKEFARIAKLLKDQRKAYKQYLKKKKRLDRKKKKKESSKKNS